MLILTSSSRPWEHRIMIWVHVASLGILEIIRKSLLPVYSHLKVHFLTGIMNIKHIDSIRNKKKRSMGFFCKALISEAENLYITFLEPEKPKNQGF